MKEIKKKLHLWQIIILILLVAFGFFGGTVLPRLKTAKGGLANDNDWPIYRGNKEKNALSKFNSFPIPDLNQQLSFGDPHVPIHDYETIIDPQGIIFADDTIYFVIIYADIVDSWAEDYYVDLFAVNINDGLKWSKRIATIYTSYSDHGFYTTSPTITSDGRIYVGVRDKIYCVSKDNPDLSCWSFQTYNLTGGEKILSETINVDNNDNIYFGTSNKYLYSLDSDGELRTNWSKSNMSGDVAIADDGTVYVRSSAIPYLGYAFDQAGNSMAGWTTPKYLAGKGSPVLNNDDTIVYFGLTDSYTDAGVLRWSQTTHLPAGERPNRFSISKNGYLFAMLPSGFRVFTDSGTTISQTCQNDSVIGNFPIITQDDKAFVSTVTRTVDVDGTGVMVTNGTVNLYIINTNCVIEYQKEVFGGGTRGGYTLSAPDFVVMNGNIVYLNQGYYVDDGNQIKSFINIMNPPPGEVGSTPTSQMVKVIVEWQEGARTEQVELKTILKDVR